MGEKCFHGKHQSEDIERELSSIGRQLCYGCEIAFAVKLIVDTNGENEYYEAINFDEVTLDSDQPTTHQTSTPIP